MLASTAKSKSKANSCEQIYRSTSSFSSGNHEKAKKKAVVQKPPPKKSHEAKSSSAEVIGNRKPKTVQPKKTVKSDQCFSKNKLPNHIVTDFCNRCGDTIDTLVSRQLSSTSMTAKFNSNKIDSHNQGVWDVVVRDKGKTQIIPRRIVKDVKDTHESTKCKRQNHGDYHEDSEISKKEKEKILRQFYKNDNFEQWTPSKQILNKLHKITSNLDTIIEQPELTCEDDTRCPRNSDNSRSDHNRSADDIDYIEQLKEFRDNNYFECHSSESRLKIKGSATSLVDHKCVYRFYLNDRLFPVPLNTDYKNTIRCPECNLSLNLEKSASKNVNGTIQAKVKMGEEDAKDVVLVLPVREPFIVRQRKKQKDDDDEEVYFGVIKLDSYGNSSFSHQHQSDSLALKYQKGYKEYKTSAKYEYEKGDDCDITSIVI